MRERNTQEKDGQVNQADKQPAASIKQLKSKILASQAEKANSQKSTTQRELEALRKRAATAPAAADELRNASHVSALRDKLFTSQPTTAYSLQKQTTLDDIKKLKAAEGHVRARAKELEIFFTHSHKALDVVKQNKVSESARAKLTIPQELKIFENQQGAFIDDVKYKLEKDIRKYSENPKLRELGYARFLELSFVYRSYEVCMEQDFRRHAAARLKKANMKHTAEGLSELDLLTGIPTQMAVESLNYYADFYKNLADIDAIWPHAGIRVRKAELKTTFAAVCYQDMNTLLAVLGDKNTDEYRFAVSQFDNAFADFVKVSPLYKNYIESGDGLDAAKHPWGTCGFVRLAQPNASINFKDIVIVDDVHAGAVHQVEERVDADRQTILPRFG